MVDVILGVIGTILYPLFSIIFLVIDAIQAIFYAFAGIGNISFGSGGNMIGSDQITSGNSGAENDTGIVYYLLNNSLVKNMLFSIMLLAFFLVIIFTVMAFIKNAYAAKPKGWKEIVGNAIKGLGNFIFLPVCVLLGVWLGNILLNAINGATSSGGSTTMARKLFIASSYNANIYRNANGGINDAWSGFDPDATNEDNAYNKIKYFAEYWGLADELQLQEGQSLEYYANKVDEMYSYDRVFLGSHFEVGHFYNLYQINYIILIVGGVFMLYALGALSASMVKRLFFILILFIISPGVCALYPLDEGKAVGSWSGEVKKQVLSAYGAVAGMNLFYSLLPLIDNIMIGGNVVWAWINTALISDIVQLFIMVIGLLTVKEIISLITGFVGGEDAYSKGTGVLSNARNKIVSGAKKGIKVAGVSSKYVKGAATSIWNVTKSGANAVGSGIGKLTDKVKNSDFVNAIETERLHNYARYHGWGEGKGKDFKYIDVDGLPVNDDFIKDQMAQEKWTQKKADRLTKRNEKEQARQDKITQRQLDKEAKANDRKLKANERAERIKSGNATFTDTLWSEGQNFKNGAKSLVNTIYEETGIKKTVDELIGEYTGAIDRQSKRDKLEADGRLGEKKAIKALNDLAVKDGGHIDSMSTSVLRAMGDVFGDAIAKRFLNGKLGKEIENARNTLGLDKTSTKSDLASVDTVLQRLQHFADRISKSTGEARDEYIKGAIEYARDTDAGGNESLQEALNEAFAKFSDEGIKVAGEVKFDEAGFVSGMTKASKSAGKAMADEMINKTKEIMADVDKENRKNK